MPSKLAKNTASKKDQSCLHWVHAFIMPSGCAKRSLNRNTQRHVSMILASNTDFGFETLSATPVDTFKFRSFKIRKSNIFAIFLEQTFFLCRSSFPSLLSFLVKKLFKF